MSTMNLTLLIEKNRKKLKLVEVRNLSVFRRSIQTFASDNNFEVHDIIPDGNCMFRALADQLMVNGFPGRRPFMPRIDHSDKEQFS